MSIEALTEAQRKVATLVARGLSNTAVGEALGISPNTVKIHLKNIYVRLRLKSRSELPGLFPADETITAVEAPVTDVDRRLLDEIASGASYAAIAKKLDRAESSMKERASILMRRFGFANRTQLGAWWIAHTGLRPAARPERWPPERLERLRAAAAEGASVRQMCAAFDATPDEIADGALLLARPLLTARQA